MKMRKNRRTGNVQIHVQYAENNVANERLFLPINTLYYYIRVRTAFWSLLPYTASIKPRLSSNTKKKIIGNYRTIYWKRLPRFTSHRISSSLVPCLCKKAKIVTINLLNGVEKFEVGKEKL